MTFSLSQLLLARHSKIVNIDHGFKPHALDHLRRKNPLTSVPADGDFLSKLYEKSSAHKRAPHPAEPFSDLFSYLTYGSKWALCLTHTNALSETSVIAQYLKWYAVKCRFLNIDRHPYRQQLMKHAFMLAPQNRSNHPSIYQDLRKCKSADGSLLHPWASEEEEKRRKKRFHTAPVFTVKEPSLPLLFVDKCCIGGADELHELEKKRKLKDVLQFGFVWPDTTETENGPHMGDDRVIRGKPRALGPLKPAFRDGDLFRAVYRGNPVAQRIGQPQTASYTRPGEVPFDGYEPAHVLQRFTQ